MNSQELYDRICLVKPVPQAVFQLHLGATVRDLLTRYGKKYAYASAEIPLREEYENALYMGILYLLTNNGDHLQTYRRLANGAYYRVWREHEAQRRREEKENV